MVVHAYRDYGDDCVAYDSPDTGMERFYFVCGRHAPFVLGPESQATWDFNADSLQQRGIENSSTAIGHGDQRIAVQQAKEFAMKQRLRPAATVAPR
jgi:hypothetical protein